MGSGLKKRKDGQTDTDRHCVDFNIDGHFFAYFDSQKKKRKFCEIVQDS